MWKRPACQTLLKVLDISSATVRAAPELLKALAILSDTTARRSAVDWEDLKPYGKLEKAPHFSRWLTVLIFTRFSKTLVTTERRLTGWQCLAVDLSPIFLRTGTSDETFQQYGKQDSFRHILKRSASIYESSYSQFFRTTTGIQSGQDTFDEPKFVVILGVNEVLCSFRLVLEEKIDKVIPESSRSELLEKFLANNLLYQMQKRTPLDRWIEDV